jgi:group I intron endonuclease
MKTGIYKIENKAAGKLYIGSAVNFASRFATHRSNLRSGKHRNKKLQNAWNAYGEAAFSFEKMIVCAKDDLIFFEQRFIDAFDVVRNGYNILAVAGSGLGYRHTEDHLARLAGNKHALGMRHTPETLSRLAAAGLGNKHSLGVTKPKHAREAVSRALKGGKQTPEQIAKRVAATQATKRAKKEMANV